jgi:hypothetical protein
MSDLRGEEAVGDEVVELEHVADGRAEDRAESQIFIPDVDRGRFRIRLIRWSCHGPSSRRRLRCL